jgi:hypothetical protein
MLKVKESNNKTWLTKETVLLKTAIMCRIIRWLITKVLLLKTAIMF